MEQYIPKSALVAEIENRIKELQNFYKENEEKLNSILKTAILLCIDECKVILSLIDDLKVKEVPIWEKVSPDTGQTTLYKDEDKSYLERFGYRIDLKELDKLPKKNLKA